MMSRRYERHTWCGGGGGGDATTFSYELGSAVNILQVIPIEPCSALNAHLPICIPDSVSYYSHK